MSNKKKTKGPNRHQARESAIETLYAWHSGGCDNADLPHLLTGRIQEEERGGQDENYLRELVYGVTGEKDALDALLKPVINRSLASVASVEINVLRLAAWEMKNRLEIPYRVIINEALELTRAYADESARGFINGVLDKLAKELRSVEVKSKP
ncbi:MAG: transcription antitermination factor NusB [Zetaproteobacteria bacterium]|nr:transcription antitermination factor NusB [Zetaproteobacteria bacterium]